MSAMLASNLTTEWNPDIRLLTAGATAFLICIGMHVRRKGIEHTDRAESILSEVRNPITRTRKIVKPHDN